MTDRTSWQEWKRREKAQRKLLELAQQDRAKRRSDDTANKISAFARRIERESDLLKHLGVSVKFLNGGLHFQFRCEDIVGNFYPTTNRLFIQRPELGPTLEGTRHKDALLIFLREARGVIDTHERYANTLYQSRRADDVDDISRPMVVKLREEILRLAARRPTLLRSVSDREIEFLIGQLIADSGWSVTVTGATRDGGRDIIAIRDRMGQEFVMYVEVKQWVDPVGIDVIHRVVGVGYINQVQHSLIVTTSRFSGPARAEAARVVQELTLVDGRTLDLWLHRYDAKRYRATRLQDASYLLNSLNRDR